ncbi:alpha/beta hydrolase family protein [Flavobacterium undicola]|uniref:alpha/beta hydrolase n=1 Tax=Flavobacterium undicola TaxID=1932779 RepID=UPI0013780722|nr:alpha/beta hydrolase [Flavobacterium undicola]MBA0882477.1 alpha/beta hydrolase [Flavobacterium undicola]
MEKLIYKIFEIPEKKANLCLHIHYPIKSNDKAFLFVNPLFDEKKRSQKFQADTARALTNKGYTVIRFDYYGTGDSYGDFEEFTINSCLESCKAIMNFIHIEIGITNVSILGIRFGASLALKIASEYKELETVFLIDPITSGKRYLMELRLRRKAFFMLNKMKNVGEKVIINGEEFEDHQGYLIRATLTEELMNLDVFQYILSDKNIFLFSLDTLNYKKLLKLQEDLNSSGNKIKLIKEKTTSFWNTMEMAKTESLTIEILKYV